MGLAQKLLNEGIMNVSQVAGVVGYENPNHFSAAFKKCFAYSPGAVLRQAV
jgi:AraC-like DNA-binding protein